MSPEPTELRTEFERELDRGEATAIAYAIDINANRVLIDEREGWATATRHDVPVAGVVGGPPPCVRPGRSRAQNGTQRAPGGGLLALGRALIRIIHIYDPSDIYPPRA